MQDSLEVALFFVASNIENKKPIFFLNECRCLFLFIGIHKLITIQVLSVQLKV